MKAVLFCSISFIFQYLFKNTIFLYSKNVKNPFTSSYILISVFLNMSINNFLVLQKKVTFKPIFRKPVTVTVTVTVKIETDRHVQHFVRSLSITWGYPKVWTTKISI